MLEWLQEVRNFLADTSWTLIVFTCLLGGSLAWIGDRIGKKIAKKKVSLFGLRPRSTGSLITAIMGTFIAFLVICLLALMSDSVRTALFSMKYLTAQTNSLTIELQESRKARDIAMAEFTSAQGKLQALQAELEKAKAELETAQGENKKAIQQLSATQDEIKKIKGQLAVASNGLKAAKSEKNKLAKQIAAQKSELKNLNNAKDKLAERVGKLDRDLTKYQEGAIVGVAGEQLGQIVVPENATEYKVREIIRTLRDLVRREVARRSKLNLHDVDDLLTRESIDQLVQRCLQVRSRKVIRVTLDSNLVRGDSVDAEYRVFETDRIYKQDEKIYQMSVRGPLTQEQGEGFIRKLLEAVNVRARASGMLDEPLTGTVGDISASHFYSVVDDLMELQGKGWVTAYALHDAYSEGPLEVKLKVTGSKEK